MCYNAICCSSALPAIGFFCSLLCTPFLRCCSASAAMVSLWSERLAKLQQRAVITGFVLITVRFRGAMFKKAPSGHLSKAMWWLVHQPLCACFGLTAVICSLSHSQPQGPLEASGTFVDDCAEVRLCSSCPMLLSQGSPLMVAQLMIVI